MKKTTLLTLFVALALTASAAQPRVKNVIYLIGDGMGFGSVSALLLSQNEKTGFEYAPVIGLSETCSANNHVTDSPAGGTALATGTRTCNGYLGVDPEGKQLTSILRKAQTMGKRTGIVVNTVLTEATPAAFYGGVKSRSESLRLAEQFVESGVDVAIGSGLSVFIGRPDSVDLTAELINRGYDVYLDWGATARSTADRFVSILPMSDVHRRNKSSNKTAGAADGAEVCLAAKLAADNGEEPTSADPTEYLTRAVEKALGTLERTADRNGYFLMIESAIIDGYGHNNDSEGMVEEMREFDRTLQMLVKYVESHPETLLVVTADHETGGTGVSYRSHEVGEEKPIILSFSTKGHTGTVVPIFAYGAGAEEFGAIMKNTELPKIIERLMQGKKKSKR
ncbi:MAG: alkaline phosphatase [Rikenellaceae bacterium]|nr:alkaline phosphatase [Rikenellaceae bacterium]